MSRYDKAYQVRQQAGMDYEAREESERSGGKTTPDEAYLRLLTAKINKDKCKPSRRYI